MNEIMGICHIVGLGPEKQITFISECKKKYKKTIALDITHIVKKIYESDTIVKLEKSIKKLELQKDAEGIKKLAATKKKLVEFWNNSVIKNIDKRIESLKKNQKLIIIGYANFPGDHTICPIIDTCLKIVVVTDTDKNVKEIIENNLDEYRDQIINNTFPLKYLEHDFLGKMEDKLKSFYTKKLKYEEKPLASVYKSLNIVVEEVNKFNSIKKLYVGLPNKYDGMLQGNPLLAFTEEWLALVTILKQTDKTLKKGYDAQGESFIEEVKPGASSAYNNPGYIYHVDKSTFQFLNKKDKYKLVSTEPVRIIKRIYVANIYKKLVRKNVKIIKRNY